MDAWGLGTRKCGWPNNGSPASYVCPTASQGGEEAAGRVPGPEECLAGDRDVCRQTGLLDTGLGDTDCPDSAGMSRLCERTPNCPSCFQTRSAHLWSAFPRSPPASERNPSQLAPGSATRAHRCTRHLGADLVGFSLLVFLFLFTFSLSGLFVFLPWAALTPSIIGLCSHLFFFSLSIHTTKPSITRGAPFQGPSLCLLAGGPAKRLDPPKPARALWSS